MLTPPQKIYLKAGTEAGTNTSVATYFLIESEEVKAVAFSYLSGESQDFGGWFYGEGMKALGLNGAFFSKDSAKAKALLNGFHPETLKPLRPYHFPKLGSKQKGSVVAVELAVTGSKHLAIAQELTPPTERGRTLARCIAVSQMKANQMMLDVISGLCQSRTGSAGSGQKISGKPMFVVFPHRLSREGDPGHHFHNILINSMECSDGKVRAISLTGFFKDDFIFSVGQFYRDEEARFLNEEFAKHGMGLKAMPFKITNGSSYKLVNDKGEEIPEEVISLFSKRSEQIDEKLAADGITEPTPKQRRNASLATRGPKETRGSVEDQQAQWRAQAAQLGFSMESFYPELTPVITVESDHKEVIERQVEAIPEEFKAEASVVSVQHGVAPQSSKEPKAVERKPDVAAGSTSSQSDRVELGPVKPELVPRVWVKAPLPNPEPRVKAERNVGVPTPDRQRHQQRKSPQRDQAGASTANSKAKELLRRIKSRILGDVVHSFELAMKEGKQANQRRFQRLATRVSLAHLSGRKIRASTFNRIIGNRFFPKDRNVIQHPLLRKRAFWVTEIRFWTGQISLSQRIFHHLKQGHQVPRFGTPKTRIGINIARSSGRISRRQQLMLLLQNGHIHEKSPEIRVRVWPQSRTPIGIDQAWLSGHVSRVRRSLLLRINSHAHSRPFSTGVMEQLEMRKKAKPQHTKKHTRRWKW